MATETTSNADEQVEKKLNEEGGADRNAKVDADLDKSQEQKDVTSASLTIPAVKYGAPEEPEMEPIKNEEPEAEPKTELSAETAEKPSEDIECNPPTQADAVKEAENSEEGAVSVEEPEHEPLTKQMEEKSEDTEKEAIDIVKEEPISEPDVSTPTPETESTGKPSELVELEESKETETSEAEYSADLVAQVKEFREAEGQPDMIHIHHSSGKTSSGAVEKDSREEPNAHEVLKVTPEEEEKPQPVAVDVEESNPSQEAVAVVGHNSQPQAVLVAETNSEHEVSEVEEKPFEPSEVNEELEGKNQEANDSVTAGAAEDGVENSESTKEDNNSGVKTAEGHSDVKVGAEDEHKATVGSMHIEENGAKSATGEVAKEERSLNEEDEIPVAYSKDVHVGTKLEVSEAIEKEPEPKLDVKKEPTANGEALDLKKDEAEEFVKTDVQNTKTPLSTKELTANEPVQEKQLQSEQLNVVEAVRKDDVNLDEKQDDTVKTDVHKPEQPTEDSDKTNRASDEIQEVPAKPKQSNNILSKMKQSLVKAKKAIIGKNPSSKTVSTEVK